ncbi:MarR family transcriptional regulator [Chitinophaga parva]|uniref:MarR family transcriptional regulator n=1 Tax=Chitinophaga parva TaxID=2169414 RepID=A0A2T7BEW8_9BACT|nr:MarR family transcriptional regulator [Chitinophaga parva]PUZ24773.1 MarR family transcriptional regulator [Chitinophaga parva]
MSAQSNDTTLDQQLADVCLLRPKSLARLTNLLKKDIDLRLGEALEQRGYTDFKLGDMALVANIDVHGTINNELARKARITKQAMSKVVKSLETAGYIYTSKDASDARASIVYLTDKGKHLLLDTNACLAEIRRHYTSLMGEKDMEKLVALLCKLNSALHTF